MFGKRNGLGLVVVAVIAALAIWRLAPPETPSASNPPAIDACAPGYFKDPQGQCIQDPYFAEHPEELPAVPEFPILSGGLTYE